MSRRGVSSLVFLLVATVALGRAPDGMLDIVITPNDGIPVIVRPGDTFEAIATREARIRLKGGGQSYDLECSWKSTINSGAKASCKTPATLPVGRYAVEAAVGDRVDSTQRAVFVVSSYPETYSVAHVSDTHLGSNRHKRASETIFRDVVNAINTSGAALAIITGDLTDGGDPEQFRQFLTVLSDCFVPTYVCSGNHDRDGTAYEQFFGPTAYSFCFGDDGYVGLDTKDYFVASEIGLQDTDLYLLRSAIKSCRWSIGFSHRYDASQGMRNQLILFVDDPLDHFLFGHWHRDNDMGPKTVPWGTTPITVTPAAIDGMMRLVTISPKHIIAKPAQNVAPTE